ncbi:EAL domain-containing protein [Thiomicrospira sp. WB1]|uniref:EAL domain-containing protein n=1 Tax=Thiomicrospira sp. WB1 TaxID=1685380 RepID=UPI000749D65F|nr:EAL domain-containing protein [Thiomicrospira sp. WB1]KUJ72566.1 hypothetical protein AVO41_01805 [Thiomicrospira sp. WB1]
MSHSNDSSDRLSHLLDEITLNLERHLVQHPALKHNVKTSENLIQLMRSERDWLQKVCLSTLDQADLEWLDAQGQRLITDFHVAIHDVFELLDEAQHFMISNLPKLESLVDPATLSTNLKKAREAIAKGFFYASVAQWRKHILTRRRFAHPMMEQHKQWLFELCDFLLGALNTSPQMDDALCPFADWLNSLEARMVIFEANSDREELAHKILLTHKQIHNEAHITYVHWKLKEYYRAQVHFEQVMQSFLMLDTYLNDCLAEYQQNAYENFLRFLVSQRELIEPLHYYLVIHEGLVSSPGVFSHHKKALLERFKRTLLHQLEALRIDYISETFQNSLHVLIGNRDEKLNQTQLMQAVVSEIEQETELPLDKELRIHWFELAHLETFITVDQFRILFSYLATDDSLTSLSPITHSQLNHYAKKITQDQKLLHRLQRALEKGAFELHFQPIVTADNRCKLVECLVRLPAGNGKLVEAGRFIHLVEEYQLTQQLDLIVLTLLLDALPHLSGITPEISVNLYPSSFGNPAALERINTLFHCCQQNGLSLILEITEHEAIKHEATLQKLHKTGVKFAIDDFGSGYSNFSSLLDLASQNTVEVVKLDGTMLDRIESQQKRRQMISFITDMARKLDLQPVICEFVDSQTKLDILRAMPSELLFQGHFFSRALSLSQLKEDYG